MTFKAKDLCCLLVALCAALVVFAPGARAQSPNYCYLQNPFAAPQGYAPFAVCREGCSRKHKGNDMFYCEGANVPIQSGAGPGGGEAGHCNIMYNGDGNPIWMNGGGYGLYMRFDCGNGIETRYAHLQGYNANTKSAINGRTGNAWTTPPHVHYEIYVNKKAVDPECALGVADPKNKCPSLPPGAANLCDPNVVAILHADAQQKLGATSSGTSMGIGPSYPPDHWPSGVYGNPCDFSWKGGPKQCSDPTKQCEKVEVPDDTPIDGDGKPIDMGDEGDWNPGGDMLDYTGIRPNTGGPINPGDGGGVLLPGTPGPPPQIPRLDPATPGENSSCAVDTWVALANQSVLEARRETLMNKRFIAKADSVFDYGCFPIYLKETENSVAALFSETDAWVGRVVDIRGKTVTMNKTLGPLSMDSALANVIWTAHKNFKDNNFNHPLMGGLEGYSDTPQAEQCRDMRKVWMAAKCQNFPAGDEVFVTFKDLIDNDPRKFPQTMACKASGIGQGMIDAAKNKATRFDKIKPRFDFLTGDACKNPPIPSGVTVYRHESPRSNTYVAEIAAYQDGVCPNAGCYYDNPGLSGMGVCQKD